MTPPTDRPDADHTRPLTERQRAMIEFEGTWWQLDGTHAELVRARFACGPDEYHQELYQLLDHPEAITVDPLTVRRLRRNQERRRRAKLDGAARSSGEHGGSHA